MVSVTWIWSGVSRHWTYLKPQGAVPSGFNPFSRGYRLAPGVLLFKGIPTGPDAFLGMPGASRLQPSAWTHLKKGLVPHLPVWLGGQQISLSPDPTAEYYWGQLRLYLIQKQSFDRKNLNFYSPQREKIIGKYFTPFFYIINQILLFYMYELIKLFLRRKWYNSCTSDKFSSVVLILITVDFLSLSFSNNTPTKLLSRLSYTCINLLAFS